MGNESLPEADLTKRVCDEQAHLDLTEEPVAINVDTPYSTVPYDPAPQREIMRGILAFTLVGIMAVVIGFAGIALWFQKIQIADLRSLFELISGLDDGRRRNQYG